MYLDGMAVAAIITVAASAGALINHFREILRAAKRPREEMRSDIDSLGQELARFRLEVAKDQTQNDLRFKNDLETLGTLKRESRLNLKSQLTVMTSLIDGNHIDDLQARRDELQEYLLNKE